MKTTINLLRKPVPAARSETLPIMFTAIAIFFCASTTWSLWEGLRHPLSARVPTEASVSRN